MSDDDQGAEQDQGPAGSASREAAKWRARLRGAEAERDALRERVQAFQRAEVTRLAAEVLADPSDLWEIGQVEVDSLLAEDGTVDTEAVTGAVAALVERRPYLAADPEVSSFDGGADRGRTTAVPTATWSGLLSGGKTGAGR